MLPYPDATELRADYDQYRAGVYKTGNYASEGDIASAINQKKVFVFKYSNTMAVAGIVLIALGVFWLWGSVITYGYVNTLIPVIIWCGIFAFAGVLGIIAKANGILLVGPHGIFFRSFLTIKVVPWIAVETIDFLPLGRLSNPFKPTICVRRVGGKTVSIIVSQLTSSEFPKSFVANGMVQTVQAYYQATLSNRDESLQKYLERPTAPTPTGQSLASGTNKVVWAVFGGILFFIGMFFFRLAGLFQVLMGLLLGLGFSIAGIIIMIYAVWAAAPHRRHSTPP